ncbi:MAG TPA: bifunctional diaminohydroxyphosphoribosylaminopyrimidine deaminase/5-amino-6-(5-phosphoribosylamino)uracil reductase RibD [Rhodopirellula sp.]|nr:bifunctional diaminohydroxyphosphoribosylaminopyrimidine deaminase/5-amino-6-(5-phosphoribosylamino)uracil reductase RibD [Rhodopirellula sp.]
MSDLPKPESTDGGPQRPLENENAVNEKDQHFMGMAIHLAQKGLGAVEPNPMVGCVLVRDGQVIATGYHQKFGGPHAEVEALRSLESPAQASGVTAYVSLEPCCHHGKTPPCAQALVDAGVSRVVVAMADPFPKVAGGGLDLLRSAGIETTVGVMQEEAEMLNAPYLKLVRDGRPWVIAKWAMTMDGRIATASGQSQWITGDQARQEVHRLRARVDGIAVGMGTVVADDPMLTARLTNDPSLSSQPAGRFVFCRHRLPALESKLVRSASDIPVTLCVGPEVEHARLAQLEQAGVHVIALHSQESSEMVSEMLHRLGQKQMTNLMLEGGAELLASFFSADQIDECHVYLGPKLFGGESAKGPIGGRGIEQIADALKFRLISLDAFGNDFRATYRRVI